MSQEKGVSPFIIFHNSVLKEMSTYFPQHKEAFVDVKGKGLRKYEGCGGEEFIKTIKEYTEKKGIDTSKIKRVEVEEPVNRDMDRYQLTYDCYLEGLSLKEIAAKRNFTMNTIIKHLEKCEENGQIIDWSRFIDDSMKEEKILAAIDKVGLERLKPIKEMLPEEISYEDIRIVIIKNGLTKY